MPQHKREIWGHGGHSILDSDSWHELELQWVLSESVCDVPAPAERDEFRLRLLLSAVQYLNC